MHELANKFQPKPTKPNINFGWGVVFAAGELLACISGSGLYERGGGGGALAVGIDCTGCAVGEVWRQAAQFGFNARGFLQAFYDTLLLRYCRGGERLH